MFWLWLFVGFVPIQNCLCAAIVDVGNGRNDEQSQESGAFRENDHDTGARIPHIMAEAAIPDVISAGQPLQEFLELHQSDPQGTTSSSKEKRCKTEGYTYDLVGSSRSSLPTLRLSRRDLQSETLKRRCEICREGARCKKLGKCELCTQICERYEAVIKEHALDIQERDVHEDTVGIASRFGPGPGLGSIPGLSEQEDRYYTVGTFAPGPIYNLLTRTLGINSKDTIERFIVLAKSKTKGSGGKPSRPVVIDTAHIFSVNEGKPKELDFEVHDVASQTKDDIDSLTSKVNSELDKAMETKRKMQENPYLTPDEIDKVIEEAVSDVEKPEGRKSPKVGMSPRNKTDDESMVQNRDEAFPPEMETPGKPSQIIGMSSRNNDEETMVKTNDDDKEDTTTMIPSPSPTIPSIGETSTGGLKVDQIEAETQQSVKGQEIQSSTDDNSQSDESAESNEEQKDIQNQNRPKPRTNEEYQQPAIPNRFGSQIFDAPQPLQPYNNEFQEVIPQEREQFNYISEPFNNPMPLPYSDNQYAPPKASYSYQYSPKAYGPKTIIPSEEREPEPEPEFNEDNTNPIYVPDGVLTDDAYLGKPEPDSSKTNFEEQYKDLKQWAKENVGSAPPLETAYQRPRIPEGLMQRVNAIIDGAASSAKTLNEKIVKLVKSKEGGSFGPDEQIVRLDNMKEFTTNFSPDQQSEAMDKKMLKADPVVAAKKNPYDAHPRIESNYKKGKWTSEKLAPNKPPYPSKHQGRMSELVGTQPDATNDEARPFIDPKLLDMKSIVHDLKHLPGYIYQKAGEVADAFRPKMDSTNAPTPAQGMNVDNLPPVAMLLSRSNTNETDEGVACSHEDSDEYYREAAEGKEANTEAAKQNEESIVGLAETREAEGEGASKEEASGEEDGQNGNETVACSKEKDKDDYELVHFKPMTDYDGYRSSIKQELSKLHLPTIDELIHPKAKSSKKTEPSRKIEDVKTESESAVSDMIKDLNKMHKHGHKTPANQSPESSEEAPQNFAPVSNFGFNPHNRFMQQPFPMNSNSMGDPNFPAMDEVAPPPQWQVNAEDENDEIIGSPILESRFQHQNKENLTHLGKIVPAESHHSPMHNRDVSDQIKPVYFLGDGIKLPLNMKQHGDGSLHLSVDVKKLCKCKHCNQKQGQNMNAQQGGGEDLGTIEKSSEDVALTMPAPPDIQKNLLGQSEVDLFSNEAHDKTEITKRSPRAKHGGDSGELVPVFGENEIFDEITPIKRFSANGKSRGFNLVKRKVGLVTDVLDWMKKVALEEAKLHNAINKAK